MLLGGRILSFSDSNVRNDNPAQNCACLCVSMTLSWRTSAPAEASEWQRLGLTGSDPCPPGSQSQIGTHQIYAGHGHCTWFWVHPPKVRKVLRTQE